MIKGVSAEQEFMEDFIFKTKDEEDFSKAGHYINIGCFYFQNRPECTKNTIYNKLQLNQAQLKKNVFEATESTIYCNKRARIKKIKIRNYTLGQTVVFRNPHHGGLVNTLNVRGEVKEKIGRDLYKVHYGDRFSSYFGCQMVPYSDIDACSVSSVSSDLKNTSN